jgi:3-dehydrosphinganine reductase
MAVLAWVGWAVAALLGALYVLGEFVFHARPKKLESDEELSKEQQHVMITGGSEGTGLALAIAFRARGCHVTIAARSEAKLRKAVEEIESKTASSKKSGGAGVVTVSADVSDFKSIDAAFQTAIDRAPGRIAPTLVVCCAGVSSPGVFHEIDPTALERDISVNLLGSTFTARAAIPHMLAAGRGRLLFMSSSAIFTPFYGFAGYCGPKAGVQKLAEALRNEYVDRIAVHVAYPGAIDTPGLVEEDKTKPECTREIEEGGGLIKPDALAEHLICQMQRGTFAITSDFISALGRAATNGTAPHKYFWLDVLTAPLLVLIGPVVQAVGFDMVVRKHVSKGNKGKKE